MENKVLYSEKEQNGGTYRHGIFNIPCLNGKRRIAVANQILIEKEFETIEKAVQYIESKDYNLLISLISFVIDKRKEFDNEKIK